MAHHPKDDDDAPDDKNAAQNDNSSAADKVAADPIKALEKDRKRLQDQYDRLTTKARGEIGDLGFWGAIGTVALVADWGLLGGMGTAFAAWSAGEYIAYSRRAHLVGKELTDVKTRIKDMQQARFDAQMQQLKNAPQQSPLPDNSLKDEFSPAAKAEIEALRDKLAKLEQQVGQMQDDKDKGLDKPKFKKPFSGKKPGDQ